MTFSGDSNFLFYIIGGGVILCIIFYEATIGQRKVKKAEELFRRKKAEKMLHSKRDDKFDA